MKIICAFSISRTGTNYLATVLRNNLKLKVHSEIFHQKEVFSLSDNLLGEINNNTHNRFIDSTDQNLINWVRSNPMKTLDIFAESAKKKGAAALYFKVFNGHFTSPKETIIDLSKNFDFYPIIIKRRCIDTFISFRKAMKLNVYSGVPTSNIKIKPTAEMYKNWAGEREEWYELVQSCLRDIGLKPILLTYEKDIDMEYQLLIEHWEKIFNTQGIDSVLNKRIEPSKILQKQDLSNNYKDKVENWDIFWEDILENGLEKQIMHYF